MIKLALVPVLLAIGCVMAGVYGALHDQISYTVSPDYFFAFKFHQFHVSPHLQNRVGAAIVGWKATWWMGAIIGPPLLAAGLLIPGARAYLKHVLIAFAVVTTTALIVGLGALAVAAVNVTPDNLPNFWFPEGVVDKVAFARVGVMHNFSYLGGFLGIVTGVVYMAIARRRMTPDCAAAPVATAAPTR